MYHESFAPSALRHRWESSALLVSEFPTGASCGTEVQLVTSGLAALTTRLEPRHCGSLTIRMPAGAVGHGGGEH